jgi:RHS repeat-associated protein
LAVFYGAVAAACAVPVVLRADAPRAPGSNTGDGSTPFTGLAQAPEANLFAGSSTTEIPIVVPPGRRNLTPRLALAYSSGGGPSPYGFGWELPLGKIQRSTKRGAIRCGAEPNDFVLSLPGSVIECRLDDTQRCLPAIEEAFLRIHYRAEDDSWEVWDKSGLRYSFGNEQMARQPIFPAPGCATFAWHLTHVEDLHGNTMRISYAYDADSHYRYPDTIEYGSNRRTGLGPLFGVRFVWRPSQTCADGRAASRPCEDRPANAISGFPVELNRLLDRIEVRHQDRLIRSYELQYDIDAAATARRARQSFLTAVILVNGNSQALARDDGLPAATTFLYQEAAGQGFGFGSVQSRDKLPMARPELIRRTLTAGNHRATRRDVFDINGDAFPDLVDAVDDCETYDPALVPITADWNVYLGGPAGFATTPTKWSVLRTYTDVYACPWIRLAQSNSSGNSWATGDTVDLTGDGIPDFVLTTSWTPQNRIWRVFPGSADPQDMGFGHPINWPAPFADVRWSKGGLHYIGWDGSGDLRDLVDVNGDALPDVVSAETTPWRVWYNTGNGFESGAGTPFETTWPLLRFTTEGGMQVAGFADINGDGLPDQIHTWERYGGAPYSGKWLVRVGYGHGVYSADQWEVPSSGCAQPGHPRWNGMRQALAEGRETVRELIDINGDSLPDIVEACGTSDANPYWTVWLNRGRGFSPAQSWHSPHRRIRYESAIGDTTSDTFDTDGDGLIDFIDFSSDTSKMRIARNGAGAWCAANASGSCSTGGTQVMPNPAGGRPDLLVQMENGLGGTTFLEYRPSTDWDNTDESGAARLPWVQWTVSRIERDDGMCDSPGDFLCTADAGSHSIATDIEYAFGRFEPAAREFRGFRTVRQIGGGGDVRDTFFHQDAARRGKAEAVNRFEGNLGLLVAEVSHWQCVALDPTCAANAGSCPVLEDCPISTEDGTRLWARLAQTARYDTTNHVIRKVSGLTNLAWDAYGNVTRTSQGGSATAAVESLSVFAHHDTSSRYQVDRATATELWEIPPDAAPRKLQASWYAYDEAGNPLSRWDWLDQVVEPALPTGLPCPGGGGCARVDMQYDLYGNVIETIDANGDRSSTSYDPQNHIYPLAVRNPLQQVVSTTHDPACGTLLSRTALYRLGDDPSAQPTTVYQYDAYCRLSAVIRPGEKRPSVRYTHILGRPGRATALRTDSMVSSSRSAARIALFDALGRPLQTQREAFVDGKAQVVVEDSRLYDERGRATHVYTAFQVAQSNGRYIRPPSNWSATRTTYDGLDRVIQVEEPDGSRRTASHGAWYTISHNPCAAAGTCAAGSVRETRDAFGRIVLTEVFDRGAFAGATRRAYDGRGKLLSTVQASAPDVWMPATTITMAYDSLGRRIRLTDPDSGAWRYGYDLNGNLLFVDDPTAQQHIAYCYDSAGRLTDKHYRDSASYTTPCGQGRGSVAYTYDSYDNGAGWGINADPRTAVGRLTRVDDSSGHSVTFYDRLGRTQLVGMTISPPDAISTTATIRYDYDAADHVVAVTYPDGERVRYSFDPVGQIRSVRGLKSYVKRLTYDLLGRPRELRHGNAVTDMRTYGGAGAGRRLILNESRRGTQHLLRHQYSYNAAGLVDLVDDTGPGGGVESLDRSAVMGYDGLGRLTSCATPANPQVLQYRYDALGNLTEKEGTRLDYFPHKPHTLAAVGGSSLGMLHDANGNRRGKTGFLYEYDRDDRLVGVNHDTVRFVYNHAGERVAMAQNGQWTRYYGKIAEAGDGYLTKYYFAGPLLIASQRAPHPLLAGVAPPRLVELAGAGSQLAVRVLLRPDAAAFGGAGLALLMAAVLALPGRRRPVVGIAVRRGPVLLLIAVWMVTTLPAPLIVSPAHAGPIVRGEVRYFHLDHLGSTQMVTDRRGQVLTHVRYAPYGGVLGYFAADGSRLPSSCGAGQSCREYTGYESEPISGLQYAGARFYDPQLGMFLTHDPARQFANPYNYAGWNPTNATDPNGEFLFDFIIAIVLAAVLSAAMNTIVAAAQGASLAQIGKAAAVGAISGAVSVGLGVVVSGISISIASAANTLPSSAGLQASLNALSDVAYRSAISSSLANAAGQTARAVGLSDGATIGISLIAGYLGSYAYDSMVLDYSRDLDSIESYNLQQASTTDTHGGITGVAGRQAGFRPDEVSALRTHNLAQDANIWDNQNHFGHGAQAAFRGADALASGPQALPYAGAASHYLQDQYALGHIFPGTHVFRGAMGAPVRFLIHQTVGGEVNFFRMAGALKVPLSFDATVDYFGRVAARRPSGIAL